MPSGFPGETDARCAALESGFGSFYWGAVIPPRCLRPSILQCAAELEVLVRRPRRFSASRSCSASCVSSLVFHFLQGSTCDPRLIPEEMWHRDGATVGAFDGDSRGRRNAYVFGNLRVQGPVHLAPVLWLFFWRVTSSAVSAARALLRSQCCRERGGRRSGSCLEHDFGGVSGVRICIDVAGPAIGRPGPRDESGLSKAQLALSWCVAPSFPPLVAKFPFLADQDDCHPPRFSAEGS